ncbi:AraC family transcriptional regulator [Caballeronia mineralivorans PML1(12)]|uniref:AraC family transcriptional regulator n=1 Tax=Caballeronia mineralivorans PML1(12) TaxID=908627 RepID=A0A0J1CT47_9BURK|nr:AraC family transcriptional regulator [Caballeronia mineralivorans]KLU23789.1 AraC family transcriptional regulator [Caballeronia mineralivorans PML1(12)]
MNAVTPLPMSPAGSRVNLRSSKGRGWNGFGAALLGISAGAHRLTPSSHHVVGVHVGPPVKARCVCDQRRDTRIQAHGDADVIPAGLEGQWVDDSDCTVLSVWISEPFTRKTLEQLDLRAGDAQIRPQLQMRDPRFQHLAWALQAELEAGDTSDPLYAESLCTAMVVRLIDGAQRVDALEGHRRKLAPRTAANVIDFIESNLEQRLTLDELAALAHLSVPHFKVLFRETLGMPVHRYVVQRRVERAKALLLQGKLSTSQVALETGFAHQSHMAHWMNRLLGVTPREIVRASGHAIQLANTADTANIANTTTHKKLLSR